MEKSRELLYYIMEKRNQRHSIVICLEKDTNEKNKVNWPINSVEYIIPGGNHAQFGDYGNQRGDDIASISKYEQWEITTNKILEWISN